MILATKASFYVAYPFHIFLHIYSSVTFLCSNCYRLLLSLKEHFYDKSLSSIFSFTFSWSRFTLFWASWFLFMQLPSVKLALIKREETWPSIEVQCASWIDISQNEKWLITTGKMPKHGAFARRNGVMLCAPNAELYNHDHVSSKMHILYNGS